MGIFHEVSLWWLGVSSFLAATILPLSSEIVLTSLLIANKSPTAVLTVATLGNVAGSIVNYSIGKWGASTIFYSWLKLSPVQIATAGDRFQKYGVWSLLFAWVPVIGDPLTFIAGLFKVDFFIFLILVTLGKFTRYWLVAQAVLLSQ